MDQYVQAIYKYLNTNEVVKKYLNNSNEFNFSCCCLNSTQYIDFMDVSIQNLENFRKEFEINVPSQFLKFCQATDITEIEPGLFHLRYTYFDNTEVDFFEGLHQLLTLADVL